MVDREKVIKKAERIMRSTVDRNMIDEFCEDVIALLKTQEAVPVIQRELMHMLVWCCGSCGVAITDGDKFCRMCGREVKWNERIHHQGR